MDNISFGSIQNILIYKKTYKQFGHYLGNHGAVKYGEKNYLELPIRFDLTDDAQGDHFTEFARTLKKCRRHYQVNCINHQNPYHVDMYMKQFHVNDECGKVVVSNFKINGCDIMLDNRDVLPLFSFMAKITRDMLKVPNISDTMKVFIKHFNKSVAKSAEEFIDMM